MNKLQNNESKQFQKEIYRINIIPQGDRLLKDLLKELIIKNSRID